METPAKYQVGKPIYLEKKREQVLNSAVAFWVRRFSPKSRPTYFEAVASTADAMITAGGIPPEEYERLIDSAIAFTDKLIEKVGEKL